MQHSHNKRFCLIVMLIAGTVVTSQLGVTPVEAAGGGQRFTRLEDAREELRSFRRRSSRDSRADNTSRDRWCRRSRTLYSGSALAFALQAPPPPLRWESQPGAFFGFVLSLLLIRIHVRLHVPYIASDVCNLHPPAWWWRHKMGPHR